MIKRIAIAVALAVVVAAGYALAGTPFGGDDTGFVPPGSPKSDIAKCETKTATNVKKAVDCIIKCHQDRANLKTTDDTGEDNCETGDPKKSCLVKFQKTASKLIGTGCAPCLNSAPAQNALFNTAVTLLDSTNGMVFCASPSGAFIDGGANL
jgi:hypothetical protein